ncbi:MAG: hypothetical protein COC08_03965 [Maribacter sp.]|nr:MAG: hypothetical protein COC08_03965 [Maribacter sp.]
MKKIISVSVVVLSVLISSCSSTQSLQEYYVDNSENPNFLSLDIPTGILNLDNADLSTTQKEALGSLKKLNILAFKKTTENTAAFKIEKANVKAILKSDKFIELMKMNTSYGKATVRYLGDENAIDEVIIYGDNEEKGFVLIRVLGNKMNPAHLVQLLQAIQKSDYKGEGLEKLGELIKG